MFQMRATLPKAFQVVVNLMLIVCIMYQGSYSQVCVKFKDFSRTSKRLPYCFQGLKTYENTDLHIKILLPKCWTALLKILVLEY